MGWAEDGFGACEWEVECETWEDCFGSEELGWEVGDLGCLILEPLSWVLVGEGVG